MCNRGVTKGRRVKFNIHNHRIRECAGRCKGSSRLVSDDLNPSERTGMTVPVSLRAGGNEETKLTGQFRNGLSESSSSNLYPREDERINPTT